ncbi:MAG: hypothetical protein KBC96_03095 [Armatimonadetes bacterium]|nr:hypothetical protein [Armatimonadota bacterium]
MANSEFSITLRNYAGVPVLDLTGEINKHTLERLEEMIERLVSAGHYNVMINLKKAAAQSLRNLESLKKVASLVQSHYGNLDLIADAQQIAGIVHRNSVEKLFRFCTSEGQALSRIRRISEPASDVRSVTARLAESKVKQVQA